MMETLQNAAVDKELAARIDSHNVELAEHNAQEAAPPFRLSDDEMGSITLDQVETYRAGLLSERLMIMQGRPRLVRERIALEEGLLPEDKAEVQAALKAEATTLKKTAAGLIKAGAGPESQPGARAGLTKVAQKQFDAAVRQTAPARAAALRIKEARGKVQERQRRITRAKEALVAAEKDLRSFVYTQIIGGGVRNDEFSAGTSGAAEQAVRVSAR